MSISDIWQQLHSCNKEEKMTEISHQLSIILDTRPNKSVIEQLLSMTLYCRNIASGLGERQLTYAMILVWYKHYPVLAVNLLSFIVGVGSNRYPCGSWRDIVGLSAYIYEKEGNKNHPLIKTAIEMMNRQLYLDWNSMNNNNGLGSNVAKWVPRENSQYGWLFGLMAMDWSWTYSSHILRNARSELQFSRATSKCKRQYRKIVSSLTRIIDPVEVKQCSGRWKEIDPFLVTQDAMQKYRYAFLEEGEGEGENEKKEDRAICATHFKNYYDIGICKSNCKTTQVNSWKNLSTYVHDAIHSSTMCNERWERLNLHHAKDAYLPVLCCSTYILDPHFLSAVGHAYLLATHSTLGRRILFAGYYPLWINLDEGADDFASSIQKIIQSIQNVNINTNLDLALKMIPSDIRCIILGRHDTMKNTMENMKNMEEICNNPQFMLLLP